ncbi:MAG: hypothetical protein NTZ74_13290 [Chloroflexi bacterium]|nr:hypothetical protein [Chloroflexota bacterium]
MSSKKDVQMEDKPVPLSGELIPPTAVVSAGKGRSFLDRALPWVIVAFVFLLIGAGTVFFTLYRGEAQKLKTAQSELDTASTGLKTAETDLSTAKGDLVLANASIKTITAQLAAGTQKALIYKFQADVNTARVALLKLDPASARQALNFVKEDLTALEATGMEVNSLSGFKVRIEEANANLASDPGKSLGALDTLSANLLLLLSNF